MRNPWWLVILRSAIFLLHVKLTAICHGYIPYLVFAVVPYPVVAPRPSRCDGNSGGSNDGLVGDLLEHLLTWSMACPAAWKLPSSTSKADPVRCDAVGDVPDHALLDGERHLACSQVRRSVGSEDSL